MLAGLLLALGFAVRLVVRQLSHAKRVARDGSAAPEVDVLPTWMPTDHPALRTAPRPDGDGPYREDRPRTRYAEPHVALAELGSRARAVLSATWSGAARFVLASALATAVGFALRALLIE